MGAFGPGFGPGFQKGSASAPGAPRIVLDLGRRKFETSSTGRLRITTQSATLGRAALERETIMNESGKASLLRVTKPYSTLTTGRASRQVFHSEAVKPLPARRGAFRTGKVQVGVRFKAAQETAARANLHRRINEFSASLGQLLRQVLRSRQARGSSRQQAKAETAGVGETEDDLSIIAQALDEEEE